MRTSTDQNGDFRLDALPQQTYRVDVSLLSYDGWRQNHLRVGPDGGTRFKAVLSIRSICECVIIGINHPPPPGSSRICGQVVDRNGRPLPHARLEFGGELAYANGEGRFVVRPPMTGTWRVVASDSGFASVTQEISAATTAPIEF